MNVSKRIKKKVILQDITMKFESGNIYLLKGHNGSGKTMFLRLIGGLIKPSSGTIKYSKPLDIGVMIENPEFLENQSGLYNLNYLASIKNKTSQEQIKASLKQVNLFQDRNIIVKEYSLGMKQRLGLCQAIMEDQELILLDEPFNALDEENLNQTIDTLKKLKMEGKIIVIAAHGLDQDKLHIFDEILHFNNGKVSLWKS
ncbi:hypothetical protein AAV98_07445 [Bacillus sp. CHD6a]|nr:hypothetical protein AAV98_07445 [Bacillus sp. CHD6a]